MEDRIRKIVIEVPEAGLKAHALMKDKDETEMCKLFWVLLEKGPMKMICHHTLSTGDYFQAGGRPPLHPVAVGSQASPLGKKRSLLCRLDPGSIIYAGGHDIA